MFYVAGEYGSAQVVQLRDNGVARPKIAGARPATREEVFMHKELRSALRRVQELEGHVQILRDQIKEEAR